MIPRLATAALLATLVLDLGGCATQSVPAPVISPQAPVYIPPAPQPVPKAPVVVAPPPPVQTRPEVDVGNRTDIALLLPLSGGSAALGRDMLDAAQLALSEIGSDRLALTPKDTKGSADGAADAARLAIAEGAKLIIGPLTAAEVAAVKPIAQQAGVNVVAFSTVVEVAGDGVFLLGFLPNQEIRRIALYAHGTGIDHFAVLAPANAYGRLAAGMFKAEAEQAGATVGPVSYYTPGAADYRPDVKRLAAGGKATFTALLLPEPDQARLKTIASLLPVNDLDMTKVRLLGTGVWDTPKLGAEPALIGGWYAAAAPDARLAFEQRFAAAFGHTPQRLATLAYDAVGMASVLQKTPGAGFSADALTNPSGFAGANGIFRLLRDGTSEHGLAVLQVERGEPTVLSPAPEGFEPSGQ